MKKSTHRARTICRLLAAMLLITSPIALRAQSNNGQNNVKTYRITGTLQDSLSHEAMPYVNIIVAAKADTALVRGSVTDERGNFEAKNIAAGDYWLRITSIGYKSRLVPLHVESTTKLGTILMQPGNEMLKAVDVTATRPLFSMNGEKMVYSVKDDPSVQSGNTSDVLQNTPGVEVDIQGNVTLRGVSSVEIWINDKPSHLDQHSLKAYLESVPANSIERIETITNPSAKYATSAEAVINIITSKDIEISQLLSVGLQGSTTPMYSPWASYMVTNKKMSLNVYASLYKSYNKSKSDYTSEFRPFDTVTGQYVTSQRDTSSSQSDGHNIGLNGGFSFDYYFDSVRSLTSWGYFGHYGYDDYGSTHYIRDLRPGGGNLYSYTDSASHSYKGNGGNYGGIGATYTHQLDTLGQLFRLSLYGNLNTNKFDRQKSRIFDDPYSALSQYRKYNNGGESYGLSFDARYEKPLSKKTSLSFGLGASINSDSSYNTEYLRTTTAAYDSTDLLRTYAYTYPSQSINGDVNLTQRWGNFTMQIGIGADYSHQKLSYDYHYRYDYPFEEPDAYNRWSFRPTIHFSYFTKSMHNFKLNYSLQTSLPSVTQLTSFRCYDEDAYNTGNPALESSYAHHVEAGWSKYITKFGNIGIDLYGQFYSNEIGMLSDVMNTVDPYLGRIIPFNKPYNIGSSHRYGTTLYATYQPSGKMNIRLYANFFNYGYKFDRGAMGSLDTASWAFSLRLNAWWKMTDNLQLFANANYNSSTISLGSTDGKDYSLGFGISGDLLKRRMSIYLMVDDIFNWGAKIGDNDRNTNPVYLTNCHSYDLTSRSVFAGLVFRFGKIELADQMKEFNGSTGGQQ